MPAPLPPRPGAQLQPPARRTAMAAALVLLCPAHRLQAQAAADAGAARWYAAAVAMRRLAESWGDQSYGAVLVHGGRIIGEGPSRVIQRRDPDAHAEREALRDARERWGATALRGAVLYSTSRPCAACEQAAAQAGVARMVYGEALHDGGAPRLR